MMVADAAAAATGLAPWPPPPLAGNYTRLIPVIHPRHDF